MPGSMTGIGGPCGGRMPPISTGTGIGGPRGAPGGGPPIGGAEPRPMPNPFDFPSGIRGCTPRFAQGAGLAGAAAGIRRSPPPVTACVLDRLMSIDGMQTAPCAPRQRP